MSRTGIQISTITANDDNITVASKIATVLQNYGGSGSNFIASTSSTENITITNAKSGIVDDAMDGSNPFSTDFTFTILIQGANKTVTEHTLSFDITEDLPLSDSFLDHIIDGRAYSVYVFANTTYFGLAQNYVVYNVISGLENTTIQELRAINAIYQGQSVNVTLPIISNRHNNMTFNISLEGVGIKSVVKQVTINNSVTNLIYFFVTANIDAIPGSHTISFTVKRGTVIYLKVIDSEIIANALAYSNLIYNKKIVFGKVIHVSLNLINYLPNNTQSLNISFTGSFITDIRNSFTLNENEERIVSFELQVTDDINEGTIEIEMNIIKGTTAFYTTTLTVDVIPKFELISVSFPDKVAQGEYAYLIMIVQNNQEESEEFSLYMNEEEVELEINELSPGENRIETKIIPTLNPYDFSVKDYEFVLEDGSGNELARKYFEVQIELSITNFIFFYLLPMIIPIGIVLHYKNKDIKSKMLKR